MGRAHRLLIGFVASRRSISFFNFSFLDDSTVILKHSQVLKGILLL